ncbi:MAG TPA: VOC family protein [Spirillospora sp.]
MSAPAFNTVAWFQVGTDRPEEARRFYGDLFGWRFEAGDHYDMVSYPGSPVPAGGVSHEPDASANHAIFMVLVEDVEAVCEKVAEIGGKVTQPATTTPKGLTFAYLQDPSGNAFGVFRPAAP